MNEINKTELIGFKGKKGISMQSEHYDLLSGFILASVDSPKSITLYELLEMAEALFANTLPYDLAWIILQVKQDLMARGLIRIGHDVNRTQYILPSKPKGLKTGIPVSISKRDARPAGIIEKNNQLKKKNTSSSIGR